MISARSAAAIPLLTIALLVPTILPNPSPPVPAFTDLDQLPALQVFGPSSTHIKHVITIVMENRVYDNYFANYCRQTGPYCSDTGNGIPNGTCEPYNPANLSAGCVVPFNLTAKQFITPDIEHDEKSGTMAYANGSMNDFYNAEGRTTTTFGHYNATTLPIYWDIAEEYATSDHFFAANLSYSLPNHWYLLAGQAPPIAEISYIKNTTDRSTYLNESNATASIQDVLNRTNVSWKYYDFPLGSYVNETRVSGWGTAYDYWNPLAARAESYQPQFASHFVSRDDLLTDLSNHTLPSISWVIPAANESDHPGYNVTTGEEWVAELLNAVESSSYWRSTAVFVIWDDYGGWFDHVAPPRSYADLLSFRSPILVVSPYARENYISHESLDFFSLLRFIEWQFGLGCVTALDCTATLPFDFFNFDQAPRGPWLFPTLWTAASYPMPLQRVETVSPPCANCLRIDTSLWGPGAPYVPNATLGD
jgi:phospholipase C